MAALDRWITDKKNWAASESDALKEQAELDMSFYRLGGKDQEAGRIPAMREVYAKVSRAQMDASTAIDRGIAHQMAQAFGKTTGGVAGGR